MMKKNRRKWNLNFKYLKETSCCPTKNLKTTYTTKVNGTQPLSLETNLTWKLSWLVRQRVHLLLLKAKGLLNRQLMRSCLNQVIPSWQTSHLTTSCLEMQSNKSFVWIMKLKLFLKGLKFPTNCHWNCAWLGISLLASRLKLRTWRENII